MVDLSRRKNPLEIPGEYMKVSQNETQHLLPLMQTVAINSYLIPAATVISNGMWGDVGTEPASFLESNCGR